MIGDFYRYLNLCDWRIDFVFRMRPILGLVMCIGDILRALSELAAAKCADVRLISPPLETPGTGAGRSGRTRSVASISDLEDRLEDFMERWHVCDRRSHKSATVPPTKSGNAEPGRWRCLDEEVNVPQEPGSTTSN